MGKPGRDADLTEKPLGLVRLGAAGEQDLDGDLAAVLEILRQVDCSHPSATDFFFDPVPIRYGGLQAFRNGGHKDFALIRLCWKGTPSPPIHKLNDPGLDRAPAGKLVESRSMCVAGVPPPSTLSSQHCVESEMPCGPRACHIGSILVTAWISAVVWQPCAGQLPGGQLTERAISASDTSQTYALYLPPRYSTDRRWPVLFVLDPRGRALLALKLFQDAAARLGWVIMSSYNTLSDGPPEPNVNAMDAMLRSAQESLSVDRSRLYLAGFSGTGRAVLRFAVGLRGHVAGVIAAGGALGFELGGPETVFARDSAFGYFGAAGTGDFNYEEVLSMGERFGRTLVPFRVATFHGPHSWPPASICGDALEWLELRAMRGGLRATDSAWVSARLEAELSRAAELEQRGKWDEALRLYEGIARDYNPWPRASLASTRASALRQSPAVKRHQSEARRLAERDMEQAGDLQKTLAWTRSQAEPPTPETLVRKLRIRELQKSAERGDSLQAASALRLLARIHAWLSFYEPRAYIGNHSPSRALAMFEAAVRIGPIQGDSCALLRTVLHAASQEQRLRLRGQCG
jgi:predicted esterase